MKDEGGRMKDKRNAPGSMSSKPLKGATKCSPGRKPWDKQIKRYIKAPEGRKKLNLNFLRPSGACFFLLNLSPRLASWATLCAPLSGAQHSFHPSALVCA